MDLLRRIASATITLTMAVTLGASCTSGTSNGVHPSEAREEQAAAAVSVPTPDEARLTLDEIINTSVEEKLIADPNVTPQRIEVVTTAGVVTLSGTVRNAATRDEFEQLTRETPGVRSVQNLISVKGSGGYPPADDCPNPNEDCDSADQDGSGTTDDPP